MCWTCSRTSSDLLQTAASAAHYRHHGRGFCAPILHPASGLRRSDYASVKVDANYFRVRTGAGTCESVSSTRAEDQAADTRLGLQRHLVPGDAGYDGGGTVLEQGRDD